MSKIQYILRFTVQPNVIMLHRFSLADVWFQVADSTLLLMQNGAVWKMKKCIRIRNN